MTTVDRRAALAAVQRVGKAVGRPGIPALTGARVDASPGALQFTCTDLELTIRAQVEAEGGSWSALIPWKILRDALKASSAAAVEFVCDGLGFVRIGATTVRCLPLEDFPTLEIPTAAVVLDGARYRDAASAVLPAASRNYARPVLTGILHAGEDASSLGLVATDSYRLHVSAFPRAEGPTFSGIVPAHAVKIVVGIIGKRSPGDVGFRIGDTSAAWHFGDGTAVVVRLIEGEFPRWEALVPAESDRTARVTFSAPAMVEAIGAAAVACRDTSPIALELNGAVTVTGSSPDLGTATADVDGATYSGSPMLARFNPGHLSDAVAAVGADRLDLRDALKPAVTQGPLGLALVMPVRIPSA